MDQWHQTKSKKPRNRATTGIFNKLNKPPNLIALVEPKAESKMLDENKVEHDHTQIE